MSRAKSSEITSAPFTFSEAETDFLYRPVIAREKMKFKSSGSLKVSKMLFKVKASGSSTLLWGEEGRRVLFLSKLF